MSLSTSTFDPTNYGMLQLCNTDAELANRAQISLIRNGNMVGYIQMNTASNLQISVGSRTNGVSLAQNATAWASLSDIEYKTELQNIETPLDKIMLLKGSYFKYKTDKKNDSRRIGVFAQDVQRVLPEAVINDNDALCLSLIHI